MIAAWIATSPLLTRGATQVKVKEDKETTLKSACVRWSSNPTHVSTLALVACALVAHTLPPPIIQYVEKKRDNIKERTNA